MIAALTPGQNIKDVITRRKSSDVNIAEKTNVDIIQFHFANCAHRNMKFQELPKHPLIVIGELISYGSSHSTSSRQPIIGKA